MANKTTRKDSFNALRELAVAANRTDLVEFVDHQLELLNNRSTSSSGKPTARQLENDGIKSAIVSTLSADRCMTISEIQTANGSLAGISNQRMSQLLSQLINAGVVVRTKDKRQSVFSLA